MREDPSRGEDLSREGGSEPSVYRAGREGGGQGDSPTDSAS